MIVIALSNRRLRFGELQNAVDGISRKVLADTLRDLERDGIVTRFAHDQMPPKVEYELSPLGRTLEAPLRALGEWAEAHFDEVNTAREAYDSRTLSSRAE